MTYEKIHAQALGADCDNCPLNTKGSFVPSVGPEKAELAFVGEAPGNVEANTGIPFSGPSGRLLKLVAKKYNIDTEEVFLTNACLCRPIDGSTPPNEAIQACRPRVLQELKHRNTKTVVAMGNSAALSILGTSGILKLRVGPGRSSPYSELADNRIVPTVHPAACLRQSDMFPSLVKDIGKVVTPNVAWSPPEWVVADNRMDALRVLHELESRTKDPVIDIEVDIEKDTAFDHPNRYTLLCVGIGYAKGKVVIIGENACADPEVRNAMGDYFERCRLTAQNGKFDLAGLYPTLGSLDLYFDTMLANYALDERPGIHGLKYQAVEDLGAPQYDDEIKPYVSKNDGYGAIPRELLYKYCSYDVSCTYDRKTQQEPLLDKQPTNWPYSTLPVKTLRDVHDHLIEASNELKYLELSGIAIDKDYIAELTTMYTESLGNLESQINDILVGANYQKINPRSPQQVKAALLYLKVRVDSTNEDTLKLILERLDREPGIIPEEDPLYQFVSVLLNHRREAKMFSTYVKGIAKRAYRGRVYPTFLLHGTTTGRLSCRNPNLQNIPRESAIRKLFIPGKPENVFVQADYAQAELRVLTWLAREPYFREILNDPNRDLFDELTPILYPRAPQKPVEDVSRKEEFAAWKELRIRVKAFVYGLGYGRTEFSVAQEYRLPVEEARSVKERFFSTIPNIVEWQKDIKKQVFAGEDLITPFGRHRRFHLITRDNWKSIQNEALAFQPQSTSSDICLRAMVRARRRLRGSGAYIRNIVHDSILADCPYDMADDVSGILDEEMVNSAREIVGDYVDFRTDISIGKHWGEV